MTRAALTFPFAHLNLRRNPFGELSLEERGRIAVADLDPLAELLAGPPFVLQVIGDCGRGKTSLLVGLRSRFPAAPYVYFPEEEFWGIYNRERYEGLKSRYDPEGRLKNLYQKTVLKH